MEEVLQSTTRHDLSDVTFIVPIFIDTPERLRNLQSNLRHLTTLFETTILIGEHKAPGAAPVSQALCEFQGRFDYIEFPDAHENFFHTRLLNQLLARVRTPLVCNLDCDAILSIRQYLIAAQLLRWGAAEFVLPHDGPVVHIPQATQNEVITLLQKRPLTDAETERLAESVWHGTAEGGAIFGVTEIYRACGGENENFLGWGWEDHERVARFQILGQRLQRAPGNFHHLSHPRGVTSSHLQSHYNANWNELERIKNMTRTELEREVATWNWAR